MKYISNLVDTFTQSTVQYHECIMIDSSSATEPLTYTGPQMTTMSL